jgi:HD-like signal output (HDOD) protein
MGLINVAELRPDMLLAEDLRNPHGRFLLAKGTRLSSKHLRILKMWGVIEANIKGVSQKDAEANTIARFDPEIIQEAEEAICKRFIHADLEHAPIHELFRICSLRKAEEISDPTVEKDGKPHEASGDTMDLHQVPPSEVPKVDPSALIRNDIRLPSLPDIYRQINDTINKPTSSAFDVGKVIGKDTSLSAHLLKIVNSTFYGFPSKIDTLSRAVTIVGMKQLCTMALGMNIMNVFKDIPSDLINMKSFWEHSIACGIGARIIANYKNIQNTERLFVGGLLHDIGRLIFYSEMSTHARNALLKAKHDNNLLHKTEYEIMGFGHTKIGGLLMRNWKLPASLENIVSYHHAPQESRDPLEPAIVHLADIITNALGIGSSGERFVPPLDLHAWKCLDISANILPLTIPQMDRQIEEIVRFLFSHEKQEASGKAH